MNDDSVKRSMFDPKFQRMDVLEYSEDSTAILENLMGEEVSPRRDFVFSRIDFSEIKE